MRLAYSSLACPGWTVEQIADAGQRYGYAGVEWRLADGSLLGRSTEDETWSRISSAGSKAVCLDTSFAFVQAADERRESAVAGAIAMGRRAAEIGAPLIRVFGGALPEGSTRNDVLEPTREALAAAAAGMPDGVRIAIETHDAWSRGVDVAELVAGIDVDVLWDVAHTVRAGETVTETLDAIGVPALVHLKDARGETLTPLGDGEVPLRSAVDALRAAGYDGWLCLEWEKLWHPYLDEPEAALPRAATYLGALLD